MKLKLNAKVTVVKQEYPDLLQENKLKSIKENCVHYKIDWDESWRHELCNKNGNGYGRFGEPCRVSLECEQIEQKAYDPFEKIDDKYKLNIEELIIKLLEFNYVKAVEIENLKKEMPEITHNKIWCAKISFVKDYKYYHHHYNDEKFNNYVGETKERALKLALYDLDK